jgi:hypothetical protein
MGQEGVMTDLNPDERAELARLRREESAGTRTSRGLRWVGATVVLVLAALVGGVAVTAVYLRGQVLDTNTFVETVAPLDNDPVVREAVAHRVTDEIVKRSNVQSLATDLTHRLEQQGAPSRLSDLVPPLVSGISSFLYDKINQLLATPQFQTLLENTIRLGHQGLVTVLTGGSGQFLTSSGNTVTIDLGSVVDAVKQQLVAQGLSIFGKIPAFTLNYTLIDSDKLPKVRTYTRLLNEAGTWLPWVALVLLAGGILLAPNRRRGLVLGFSLLGLVAILLLVGIGAVRSYYVDNLPPQVQSPDAAAAVISAMLRFLIAALQTLLVVCVIFVIGGLLAGPSTVAVGIRRLTNRGLDALAGQLRRTGNWFAATGRALRPAHRVIQVGLVVLAVVAFVAAASPGIAAALWATVVVLAVLAVLELFVRGAGPTAA